MASKMKASIIEGKDLRTPQNKRIKLHEATPLGTPLVLFIDPTNLCNIRCQYCPTGDKELLKATGRPNGVMNFELFKKIVEDIKEFGEKIKLINFYKDGEPLANKMFPEMASHLVRSNVAERVWLKTNGLLLNPELNKKLIASGIHSINISIQHISAEGYKKIALSNINYENLLSNIKNLYLQREDCKLYVKIANTGLSKSDIQKFQDDFSNIADAIYIEQLHGWSMSNIKDFTLGTNPTTFDGLPLTDKIACPWPFYEMAINWDGTVSLCNEDWAHKTLVGDTRTNSLKEIWNGSALFNMRKMMLENRRHENPMCKNCYNIKTAPDNIDPYRKTMLKQITEAQNTTR